MKPLISHGARDEVFVMGLLGIQIDIATLIDRINATPMGELDIREQSTADLVSVARQNGILPFATGHVSPTRMEEPVLVITVQGEPRHWLIDGNHRVAARRDAGLPTTSFVAVTPSMIEDLISPFPR